jgi:lipopolysaccharide transport system ATP-binding protein
MPGDTRLGREQFRSTSRETGMNQPRISLTGVSKAYPSDDVTAEPVVALADVTLVIENGERVGIIGDNGAGKSTLLQIIAGVNAATSGRVELQGKVHAILTVGLGLREEATGRENLFLEGAVLGKSHDEIARQLDEMIAFAELGAFIDQPMRTYSSGMKARLAFACLAHIDPEILIIDEALSVGDVFFAAKATKVVQDLCARGRIVIIVSHGISTIKSMCQRCIWLEHGRVRADGPSNEVGDAYARVTRERQEAEVARKFGDSGQTWCKEPGNRLLAPRILVGDPPTEVASFDAGSIATISGAVALDRQINTAGLRIWVESNDGQKVIDQRIELSGRNLAAGQHDFAINLGMIDWRPFVYQLHLVLMEAEVEIAHAAATFKVISDDVIFGGNPLLRTPPSIVRLT